MGRILLALVACSFLAIGQCAYFKTCLELAKGKYLNKEKSGSRLFKPRNSKVKDYVIFCDFQEGYGYTFISTKSFTNTDIAMHNVDESDFKIIFMREDGSQHESVISPEDGAVLNAEYRKDDLDLGIPVRNIELYPYIAMSLTDKISMQQSKVLSYKVNGRNFSQIVCDPEGYGPPLWAFYFNERRINPDPSINYVREMEFLKKWVELSRPAPRQLPRNFFAFFETSFWDCRGYMTATDFPKIIGAAVGLKYVVECPSLTAPQNGGFTATGYRLKDVVTFHCDAGYELTHYNTVECNEKGKWVGDEPYCIEIRARNCGDIVKIHNSTLPGEYVIYTKYNSPVLIYCDFYDDHVLSFIPDAGILGNADDIYDDKTEVVLRTLLMDGRQVESTIRQTTARKDIPFEINVSGYSGVNVKIEGGDVENQENEDGGFPIGYNVNGKDVNAVIPNCCDGYKGLFSFASYISQSGTGYAAPDETELIRKEWLTHARPLDGHRYMPKEYFRMFYTGISEKYGMESRRFPNINGVTIGLRSNL